MRHGAEEGRLIRQWPDAAPFAGISPKIGVAVPNRPGNFPLNRRAPTCVRCCSEPVAPNAKIARQSGRIDSGQRLLLRLPGILRGNRLAGFKGRLQRAVLFRRPLPAGLQ
jgi:hypothetical protein